MTMAPEELLPSDLDVELPDWPDTAVPGSDGGDGDGDDDDGRPVRVSMVAAAAALSSAAGAWMAGGLVRGTAPKLVGLLGVAIGVGLVWLSYRTRRPQALQYLVLPVAAVAGAVLVAPVATGGTANLPGLVGEALDSGGLLQPPIPFDPGWRFLLVVTFAVIGAAAASVAISRRRPRLAVLIPLPLTFGAALLQPSGNALVASAVAMFLVIASATVAFGADVAATEDSRGFEVRRLGRGVVMLVALMVAMAALARTDFLFPDTTQDRVIPPQRPPATPLEKDRELFRVSGDSPGPWRTGVLDMYDGRGWLLPPLDTRRVVSLSSGAPVPAEGRGANADDGAVKVSFHVVDMRGRALPVPARLATIDAGKSSVDYDPRTQSVRLKERIPQGFEYTADAGALPPGTELNAAAEADRAVVDEFAAAPSPPADVAALLAEAPERPFDRLQFLRDRLYANVTAAGAGSPTDVTPLRVSEMLKPGSEATPFEITAAEALLARWAGLPARIGFGYHGGNAVKDGLSFRPKHGAAWLEAYFGGFGWVPLVGTPPKAKSSVSEEQKLEDPTVQPTDELAIQVYIPVRRNTLTQLFQTVRYWFFVAVPWVLLAVGLVLGYPVFCKAVRSSRRRRWGVAHGPRGRAYAAYADFRDRCYDLNLGDVRDTPLEFRLRFDPDGEHDELAWLTTRFIWGDLRRDERDDDAAAAARLIASVQRRIGQAQSTNNRVLGRLSRASLRDPYSDDVPNFHPRIRLARLLRSLPRLRVKLSALRPRRLAGASSVVLVVAASLVLSSCAPASTPAQSPSAYPDPLVPEPGTIAGVSFQREPAAEAEYGMAGEDRLVSEGRVFTMRQGDVIQGTLQVALFKPDIDASTRAVQRKVEGAIGGTFVTRRIGTVHVRERATPEQRFVLWFPPERNVMMLFVLRRKFAGADDLVWGAIGYVRGVAPADMIAARRGQSLPLRSPEEAG